MKRALSIIIALSLAFSLLPTFAAAEETTETATEPYAFTLDFSAYNVPTAGSIASKDKIGPKKSGVTINEFKGENWKALLDATDSAIYSGTGSYVDYRVTDAGTATEDAYLFFYNPNVHEANKDHNTFSLTFDVPVSGVYDISSYVYNGKQGGYTEMIIDGKIDGGKIENNNKGDINGKSTKNEPSAKQLREFNTGVALSAGTHTMKLTFTAHELADVANRADSMIYDFTFTPSTVTAVDSESVKLAKNSYEIGDTFLPGVSFTAQKETSSGTVTYDVAYDEIVEIPGVTEAVELTSSNESVVKCSDSAFIALTAGTAELTAKISVNGIETEVVELGTVTVSPAAEAKDFTLDFANRLSSVDDLTSENDNYYFYKTTDILYGSNWSGISAKDTSTILNSPRRVSVKTSYISMMPTAVDLAAGKDTLLFAIFAPADGVYDVTSDIYVSGNGGYLKLYIDDIYVGENSLNSADYKNVAKNTVTYASGVSLTAGRHVLKLVNSPYTAGSNATNGFYSITFSVSEEKEAESTNAFTPDDTDDITDSYIAPTVSGLTTGGAINPVANGDGTYRITAPEEKDGAKFLYWAKGLTANKKIISFSNVIENYVPEEEGRNVLIAVYEGEEPQADEFYNANGQLIPGATQDTRVAMAGYGTTNDWNRYGETNIYVASYALEAPAKNIPVTVTGGEGTDIYAYGDTVTCTATGDNFKYWKKNGEIVSIDKTYIFKAWEGCTVEAFYGDYTYNGETKKIVIDSFNVGSATGIMAEFIGFDSNVVEKGIMFTPVGETEATKIAMTKPGSQFSVIADANGEYVGYAILKNGDAYTLITDGSVTISIVE